MKPILTNIKNIIPYLILIVVYFIFIYIEARKDNHKQQLNFKPNSSLNITKEDKLGINNNTQRISIPVIPYKP
tara:strand:+ start:519 stop:737 length:219 start_codon:yes stop_codon:yes gene_type:complete